MLPASFHRCYNDVKLQKRKIRSCAIPFINRKMKAKGKNSPILWLNLIILLLNMLPPHPPCGSALLLIAGEWSLQSMGVTGDEQIPIRTWGTCVPDSLHRVQFILVDINIMPKVWLLAYTKAFQRTDIQYGNRHFRVYMQQLTAGIVTKQRQEWPVRLKLTSANKSLFHAAALCTFGLHFGELQKGIFVSTRLWRRPQLSWLGQPNWRPSYCT